MSVSVSNQIPPRRTRRTDNSGRSGANGRNSDHSRAERLHSDATKPPVAGNTSYSNNIPNTRPLPETIKNELIKMGLDFNEQQNSDGSWTMKNLTKEQHIKISDMLIKQFQGDGMIFKTENSDTSTRQVKIIAIKISKNFSYADKSVPPYCLSITAQEVNKSKTAGLPDAQLTPKTFEYSLTREELSSIFGINDVFGESYSLKNPSANGNTDKSKVQQALDEAWSQVNRLEAQLSGTEKEHAAGATEDTEELEKLRIELLNAKAAYEEAMKNQEALKEKLSNANAELENARNETNVLKEKLENFAAAASGVPHEEARVLVENQLKQSKNNILPYILSAIGLTMGLVGMGVMLGIADSNKKDAEDKINEGENSVTQSQADLDNAENGDYSAAGDAKGRDAVNQETQKDKARYEELDKMPSSPKNDELKQEIAARYTSTSDGVPIFSENTLTDIGTEAFQTTYDTAYSAGVSEAKADIVDAATKQLESAEKALSNAERAKENANKFMEMGGSLGGAMSLLGIAGLGVARKRHNNNIESARNAHENLKNLENSRNNGILFKAISMDRQKFSSPQPPTTPSPVNNRTGPNDPEG
ncbi:hypothetical protein [Providencia sp. Me31A]|uniref:hypothetical protein n=1 Tax=Providencia sp. Me31A TaxID=3392637 RepID=UPI003D28627E